MSDSVWNLGFDGQQDPNAVLFAALHTGVILGGSSTSFSMKDGANVAIFHGNFTVANGAITGGTIGGFSVFYNSPADKLMDVSGYAIDFGVFHQAVIANNAKNPEPIAHLLFDNPMTVNGANQPPTRSEAIVGGIAGDHLHGNAGKDFINDIGGSDVIEGGIGDDTIHDDQLGYGAIPGADFLFGNDGDDTIVAGGGSDFLSGGQDTDILDGGPGSDTADYSEKLDTIDIALKGPNDTQVLVGGFAEDTIRNIENANGGQGDDKIKGDGLINHLVGNGGKDTLLGRGGNDLLEEGIGKDNLKGGANSDTFLFNSALGGGNVDRIKDLHGLDHIALDSDIFAALPLGALKAKFFHAGTKAADGNDHLIYDESTGKLSYDADGKGRAHQVLFAKIFDHGSHHTTLHPGDFLII